MCVCLFVAVCVSVCGLFVSEYGVCAGGGACGLYIFRLIFLIHYSIGTPATTMAAEISPVLE